MHYYINKIFDHFPFNFYIKGKKHVMILDVNMGLSMTFFLIFRALILENTTLFKKTPQYLMQINIQPIFKPFGFIISVEIEEVNFFFF
jgi:hypothetical protein